MNSLNVTNLSANITDTSSIFKKQKLFNIEY